MRAPLCISIRYIKPQQVVPGPESEIIILPTLALCVAFAKAHFQMKVPTQD